MAEIIKMPPLEKFESWFGDAKMSLASDFCNFYNRELNTSYYVYSTNEDGASDFSLKDNQDNKIGVNHKFIGSEKREYLEKVISGAMSTWERIYKSLEESKDKNFPKDIILLLDFRFPNFISRELEIAKNDFNLNHFFGVWIFNRWSIYEDRKFIRLK